MQAIDADQDVRPFLQSLKASGCKAVGRYYSKHAWKVMSAAEAKAISDGGMEIFAVYEDGNAPGDFGTDAGTGVAKRALAYAQNTIGQPRGSAIYFAVDYPADAGAAAGAIRDYFVAIGKVFADAGAPYRIGVYADGVVCQYLLDQKLVALAWLTQSKDHPGYKAFYQSRHWAIAQGMPPAGIPKLDADPDEINGGLPDFGGFRI